MRGKQGGVSAVSDVEPCSPPAAAAGPGMGGDREAFESPARATGASPGGRGGVAVVGTLAEASLGGAPAGGVDRGSSAVLGPGTPHEGHGYQVGTAPPASAGQGAGGRPTHGAPGGPEAEAVCGIPP